MQKNKEARKILLFGATGRTGSHVLRQALKLGYEVTAVVRNPENLTVFHPGLTIVQGDICQHSSFQEQVYEKDVLISCIGVSSNAATTLYSSGTQNMLEAMDHAGVRRIICISAAAIETSPKLGPLFRLLSKYVVQRIFRKPYADTRLMEKKLKESDTNWTLVRVPLLKDKALTGKYRYAINSWLDKCYRINRADLAAFLIASIDDSRTYRAVIEVAN